MGTSQSSRGPGKDVPLVPPWVPPLGDEKPETDTQGPDEADQLAPAGRFGPARKSLGSFGRSGSGAEMRRGVAHYVSRGLGGGATATRRLGAAVAGAARLGFVLDDVQRAGGPTDTDVRRLFPEGPTSVEDTIDRIVEAVRPVDGSQDAESGRFAISRSLDGMA